MLTVFGVTFTSLYWGPVQAISFMADTLSMSGVGKLCILEGPITLVNTREDRINFIYH